ncbi:MAG: DsrE family protein [Acidimicrobiales bacterium]
MTKYLWIETRDPFDSADVADAFELVRGLADESDDTAVYLVQNGVLTTRRVSTAAPTLAELAQRTTVLADEFSLRERGITTDEVVEGVTLAGVDRLVELLLDDDRKVIWH